MTSERVSENWSRRCAPIMTGSMAACRWIVSVICLASVGRGLIAATSGRPFCPLTRYYRPLSARMARSRTPAYALSAGGPFSRRGGKPTAPKPARPRETAEGAGSACGKSVIKTSSPVTICLLKKPGISGFFEPLFRA